MESLAFILNLPSEITTIILSRLPIRSIAICKCVCTKWLNLIATPEFAKYHLPTSSPGLIVHLGRGETLYRIVEFEDVPLHHKPVMKFNPAILSSSPKTNIHMACSVDGLLCLREPDYDNKVDTVHICNPITREYITLPRLEGEVPGYPNIVTFGVGISLLTSQYKLVRIFHDLVYGKDSRVSRLKLECTVYTLGTGSWRNVEPNIVFEYTSQPSYGVFFNGNLHWTVEDDKGSHLISCFDLETELFKPFPPPLGTQFLTSSSLTVVGGCLCICNYGDDEEIVIWRMKEYGVEESWTKECVINKYPDLGGISYESVYFFKVFKDGEILMLWQDSCLFYHCPETETNPEIDLLDPQDRNPDTASGIDAQLYTPSFVSLRSFSMENIRLF